MIKGLSIPVVAKYNHTAGSVTYTDGMIADHAVSYGVTWTVGDDNPGYADNMIQENDKGSFQSGDLTLGTADIPQELSKLILGTKVISESGSVEVEVYDDEMSNPYLGFGIIEAHQMDDVNKFKACLFPKVYFNIPEDAASTKAESISWQTPTISGKILRSDESSTTGGVHPWKKSAWFTTEAAALAWLKTKLNVTTSH